MKETYLYFAEATVETTGEAALYPASSFIAMTPNLGETAGLIKIVCIFKSRNGAATVDSVELACTSGKQKEAMASVIDALNAKPGFVNVADSLAGKFIDNITACNGVTTEA